VLSDQEKKGVLSFIGYGSPSAPLWFIGAEEGLGGKMRMSRALLKFEERALLFKSYAASAI